MIAMMSPPSNRSDVTRRRLLEAGVAGLGLTAGCMQQTDNGRQIPAGVTVERVLANLTVPWDLTFAPDGDLYFTERPGRINVLPADASSPTTLSSLPNTAARGEGGLLGITLHPAFPQTPALFVYQTYRGGGSGGKGDGGGLQNRILRFRRTSDGLDRRETLLDGIPGGSIHDGGRLAVGPDDTLYATTGDAGRADSARDPESLAGKILRLTVDGEIPANNPFADSFTWSYGHRNPQGLARHPRTDELYATEHGSSGHDEVNHIRRGNDYGWPSVRGTEDRDRFTPPVLESGNGTWAPTGATVYTGTALPEWDNDLFFTTLGFSPGDGRRSLHRVGFGPDGTTVETHAVLLTNQFGRLRTVTQGPDGHLYVATSNRDGRGDPVPADDRILRLRPDPS